MMNRPTQIASKLRLGILSYLRSDPYQTIEEVHDLGFRSCQVWCRAPIGLTDNNLSAFQEARLRYDVEITGLWVRCAGPAAWNFMDGPRTIGIVPARWRQSRIRALQAAADFASALQVPTVATHCGFIPENPRDRLYAEVIEALAEIVAHCRRKRVTFCFETGQETPVVLLRCIEDLGVDGIGINFDGANLIGYGKGNPVDALDLLGPYVRGVHAKDATPPPNGYELGRERPVGQGRVDFHGLFQKLKEHGYAGDITIENEMQSRRRVAEIHDAHRYLQSVIDENL